jgi:hypothetical protein
MKILTYFYRSILLSSPILCWPKRKLKKKNLTTILLSKQITITIECRVIMFHWQKRFICRAFLFPWKKWKKREKKFMIFFPKWSKFFLTTTATTTTEAIMSQQKHLKWLSSIKMERFLLCTEIFGLLKILIFNNNNNF